MRWDFELIKLALPPSGLDLQAAALQIQQQRPDWLLLWAPGSITAAALKAAVEAGIPARRIIGFRVSAVDTNVAAAGFAAIGYLAVAHSAPGLNFPVIRDIIKHVHARRRRGLPLPAHVGSLDYNRGVAQGVLIGEAIRVAQMRHGAKLLNGDELRWGLLHLSLADTDLVRLGARELLQAVDLSCRDHVGGSAARMLQWLGNRWTVVSDWIVSDSAQNTDGSERSIQAGAEARRALRLDCAD